MASMMEHDYIRRREWGQYQPPPRQYQSTGRPMRGAELYEGKHSRQYARTVSHIPSSSGVVVDARAPYIAQYTQNHPQYYDYDTAYQQPRWPESVPYQAQQMYVDSQVREHHEFRDGRGIAEREHYNYDDGYRRVGAGDGEYYHQRQRQHEEQLYALRMEEYARARAEMATGYRRRQQVYYKPRQQRPSNGELPAHAAGTAAVMQTSQTGRPSNVRQKSDGDDIQGESSLLLALSEGAWQAPVSKKGEVTYPRTDKRNTKGLDAIKQGGRSKSAGRQKGSKTGYNVFCGEYYTMARNDNPDLKHTDMAGILAKQWKSLSESAREEYNAVARQINSSNRAASNTLSGTRKSQSSKKRKRPTDAVPKYPMLEQPGNQYLPFEPKLDSSRKHQWKVGDRCEAKYRGEWTPAIVHDIISKNGNIVHYVKIEGCLGVGYGYKIRLPQAAKVSRKRTRKITKPINIKSRKAIEKCNKDPLCVRIKDHSGMCKKIPAHLVGKRDPRGKPSQTPKTKPLTITDKSGIRILTVKQPWASAIIFGPKRIENRKHSFKPRVRADRGGVGEWIAVHTSRAFANIKQHGYSNEMLQQIWPNKDQVQMPKSKIIGLVRLRGSMDSSERKQDPWAIDGWHCWAIDRVIQLPPTAQIEVKGKLGLWYPEPAASQHLNTILNRVLKCTSKVFKGDSQLQYPDDTHFAEQSPKWDPSIHVTMANLKPPKVGVVNHTEVALKLLPEAAKVTSQEHLNATFKPAVKIEKDSATKKTLPKKAGSTLISKFAPGKVSKSSGKSLSKSRGKTDSKSSPKNLAKPHKKNTSKPSKRQSGSSEDLPQSKPRHKTLKPEKSGGTKVTSSLDSKAKRSPTVSFETAHPGLCANEFLKELQEEPEYYVFSFPVDEVRDGAQGYHKIVKKPCDFATISERLKNNAYPTNLDYRNDLMLIVDNAKLYNQRGSLIHAAASKLQEQIINWWVSQLPDEELKSSFGESRKSKKSKIKVVRKFPLFCKLEPDGLASEFLSRLEKEPRFRWFLKPVDEKRDFAKGYYLIIKKPCDFQKVRANLTGKKYSLNKEFKDDLLLIGENAKCYNQPGSKPYLAGRLLQSRVYKWLEKEEKKEVARNQLNSSVLKEGKDSAPNKSVTRKKSSNTRKGKKGKASTPLEKLRQA